MTDLYNELLTTLGKTRRNVTVLQVGAADGKRKDPLNPFITKYRWAGLLIEPLPDLFLALQQTYKGHDNLRLENLAVSDAIGTRSIYRVPLSAVDARLVPGWAFGISSFYNDRNAIGGKRVKPEEFEKIKKLSVEEKVNCAPLDHIISRHPMRHFDVFQIDTEGYDYHVLKQFDFRRCHPSVVYMEFIHLPSDEKRLAQELLENEGYICQVVDTDLVAYDENRPARMLTGP